MKPIIVVPVVGLLAMLGLLIFGLTNDPRAIPSPFIDKPAPSFSLPTLANPQQTMTEADLKGEVSLVNVWASWCVACRHEHGLLVDLAKQGRVRIIGLNYNKSDIGKNPVCNLSDYRRIVNQQKNLHGNTQ